MAGAEGAGAIGGTGADGVIGLGLTFDGTAAGEVIGSALSAPACGATGLPAGATVPGAGGVIGGLGAAAGDGMLLPGIAAGDGIMALGADAGASSSIAGLCIGAVGADS